MTSIGIQDGAQSRSLVFTMLIGEVDHVPGTQGDLQAHKISTRFFAFIGPLVPFESLCVTYENHLGGRTTRHSWSGERVKLNLWSILLGYLRVWLSIGVFVPSGYDFRVAERSSNNALQRRVTEGSGRRRRRSSRTGPCTDTTPSRRLP